jgi:hypothetical protein
MNLIRLCCFLLFTQIYSQDIRINELVASNSTFQDEDGDTPDWIELYNYGSSPVSLINWSISDEEDDTNPWVFPEIILNEDEYMLLWASNKNRGQLTYPRTLITEGDLFKHQLLQFLVIGPILIIMITHGPKDLLVLATAIVMTIQIFHQEHYQYLLEKILQFWISIILLV